MCGIVGIARVPHPDLQDAVERMTRAVAHRGPDDTDLVVWPEKGVGLGHRRLSIIDLSTDARQPMKSEDGRVWIVYNGEVYNYADLRRELQTLGHRFRSHSDTEVVLNAYLAWGDDHVHRLRGMFGYAIYDRRSVADGEGEGDDGGPDRGRFLLVRDRLGIKPLHYHWDGTTFGFASELGAFRASAWFDRTWDPSALVDYLSYLYVPAPKTAYRSIHKLPAGHVLVFEGDEPRVRPYWDLTFDGATGPGSLHRVVERTNDLVEEAVRVHMVSDVPVGVFLSGGIDSSTITAHAAREEGPGLRTFSIGFDVAEHSESHYARLVAEKVGTRHRERTVEIGSARDLLPRITRFYGEPYGDGSAVPTLQVSSLAREDVKVVLSGDGGDEVFAGYRWYSKWLRTRPLVATDPRLLSGPLRRFVGMLPARSKPAQALALLASDGIEAYGRIMSLFTPEEKRSLAGPLLREAYPPGYDDWWSFRRYWRADVDPLTRVQYVDLKTYLPDDILTKVDRAAMACSLEVRPPLLDHRLVEEAFRMLPALPIETRRDKRVLREAAEGILPEPILRRGKKGFSAPWKRWFEHERKWALDHLRDGEAIRQGILAPDATRRMVPTLPGSRLWALLVLEQWARDESGERA